ncbi:MAG: hypothetical protein ACI837_000219 [Crocinitomicaceae bacterium]|jgi:hypothetical protein
MISTVVRFLLILGILTLFISYAPSHFQKGGVLRHYYLLIPSILFLCSLIWILPKSELSLSERIVLSFVAPLIALIISTFWLMEVFISWRYSDKTWVLWKDDERIITNTVYYSITILLVVVIIEIYKRVKQHIKKPNVS